MANINRVNELPSSGLTRGDQFLLNVGGGKYQTYIVSDSLQLVKEAGADFIEKDTMAEMRALSAREIWALKNGYYKGVTLNGYQTVGDTPKPIHYYLSENPYLEDNEGAYIQVSDILLVHEFIGSFSVKYFGIIGADTVTSVPDLPDISDKVQKAEDYRFSKSQGLQLIWDTSGYMKITKTINLNNQINWVNPVVGSRDTPNFKIYTTNSILFAFKSGISSNSLTGIFKGMNFEYWSENSVNSPEGKTERINSIVFYDMTLYSMDFSWNWFKHYGTIIYGAIANLTRFYQNRIPNFWRSVISCYKEGETSATSKNTILTDSRIFNNFVTGESSIDNTAFIKGNNWGHMSIYSNFIDFTESVFDNSIVNLSLYCTGSKFYGNIIDYCINIAKGNFSFMTIDDNHIMNMSVRSATTIDPEVNWGKYGTSRIKNMEWGLFKDIGRMSYVIFTNNRIEHLDFIVKNTSSATIFEGVTIKNNGWYKCTNNGRRSNSVYSLKELIAKFKVKEANTTINLKGQQNDFSDLGFITDRTFNTGTTYAKASKNIDAVYQLSSYQSSTIDDVRNISLMDNSDAFILKNSTSGKAVFITGKRDTKAIGNKFAYEISDDLVNGRLYEGDVITCAEIGQLTYTASSGLVDSNGVKRILTAAELISYSGSANVVAYVYDLGSFVQLFSSSSKPWRGNNVIGQTQITNISAAINTFGTSLPTTQLIPDRPFILLDGSNNIISIHKVDSNYEWVVYNPTTKIRYDELLRDYGTTALRPKYFVKDGFTYYNTETKKLEILDGGVWKDAIANATTTVKGLVNQAAASADTAAQASGANPTKAEFDALLAELRDLKTKMRSGSAPILAPNTP